jgi:restriction system protein
MAVPAYDELFNPTLEALRQLGGSGRNEEIEEKISEILKLTDDQVNEKHRGTRTKLNYRGAWARNYLKRYGLVENSSRGVWSLTSKGQATQTVDLKEVKRFVKNQNTENEKYIEDEDLDEKQDWEEELLGTIKLIEPAAFERLCQRLLRESGFTDVKVEGRSGDGGIDGRGIYKMGGLISMRVIFQAKRYRNSVSSQEIREFKGTMSGRAEKGLFITTGTYTRDAKQEAVRDGSVPIDLVDGQRLAELLKELGLGVSTELTEEVTINKDWFSQI